MKIIISVLKLNFKEIIRTNTSKIELQILFSKFYVIDKAENIIIFEMALLNVFILMFYSNTCV